MIQSRVPWMFTGRPTICIRRRRSGTSAGQMSGSSSLSGRLLIPGIQNALYSPTTSSPTRVRSRSLVPAPSASNGAWSSWRYPVTALPRRTAAVSGGRASRTAAQNWSSRRGSPPKASRITRSRISASLRPARTASPSACSAIVPPPSPTLTTARAKMGGWMGGHNGEAYMIRVLIATAGAVAIASLAAEATVQNPLLAPWTGPYGGVPPFDKVKVEHFQPALAAAMAEQLAEVDKIANDPAPPTFENTLAALERSGRTLDRVGTIFGR